MPNKLPSKEVAILAHRRKRIQSDQAKVARKRKFNRRVATSKGLKFKGFIKPERLVADFRKAERDNMRMKREAMKFGLRPKHFVPDGSQKLILVYRHRGEKIASKNCIKILRELGLAKKYYARFVESTPETLKLLAAVEPYVSWGYPNISIVRDLIFKYGFCIKDGKRKTINSNMEVEKALGHINILCIEDLVHEIFTVGPNFNETNTYMTHFILQAPKTGWEKSKGQHFVKGGECGFRGEEINDLFKTIL